MSITAEPHPLSEYNSAAIDIAATLHEHRVASAPDFRDRTIDQLITTTNRAAVGVFREYERMGNQPVSDDLLRRAEQAGVTLEHLGITIGTVIHGIDVTATLDADAIKLIRDTLLERKVIFFRDQFLDEDQHVAFGRCFGELDAFPFGKPGGNPFILQLEHGRNSPGRENAWHTDVTWMETPSLGSIAQCIAFPPAGGDTLFSDSHACYLGLPSDMADRLQHVSGVHDYRLFLAGRGTNRVPDHVSDEIKAQIPFGVEHPLVRTHPETGKQALYFNGAFLRHDSLFDSRTREPLGAAESREIMRSLVNEHARQEYVCRFSWEPGSIAFWDNRAVQHYAASDYFPHKRVLRRVTVSGDRPFFDPTAS